MLSADTTVALEGEILGKPADREQAISFLKRLSGKAHQVHTAVAVKFDQQIEVAVSTTVGRVPRAHRERDAPVRGQRRAPGQGRRLCHPGPGAVFIRSINGSYTGVVGLPLFETSQLLARLGHPAV